MECLAKYVVGVESFSKAGKRFYEPLMELLAEGSIVVKGYDFSVHKATGRIQAFKKEGVVFTLVKTEKQDIFCLLHSLESSHTKDMKKGFDELREIFETHVKREEDKIKDI